jgi:protein-tyrosine phosphatase
MNAAKVNDWLWVGNRDACGAVPAQVCVHVYRSDKPDSSCPYHRGPRGRMHGLDLCVDYRDGDPVAASDLQNLAAVAAKLREAPAPTLVHCHAGICRSPTLAAYLWTLVEDDVHPLDAFAKVARAVYDQRERAICNLVHEPLRQLIRLVESARQRRA